jgi:hypothetical protein
MRVGTAKGPVQSCGLTSPDFNEPLGTYESLNLFPSPNNFLHQYPREVQ